jgi:hypothetical protein
MKIPKSDGSALVKEVANGFIALLKKASAGAKGEFCKHLRWFNKSGEKTVFGRISKI